MKHSITCCVWIGLLAFSCKKTTSDNGNTANPVYDLVRGAFSIPPIDTADITALVPLGNLNPPAHTFPTDHMYFYCFTSKSELQLKAPGNVQILRIGRSRYNIGTPAEKTDYTISLGSDNSYLYWGHVSKLSARLMTAVNNFSGAQCPPAYTTGGISTEQCFQNVAIMASPGEILGTVTTSNGLTGMDFGATVNGNGTNPLEYFENTTRASLESKLGRFDGSQKRTAIPLCGEINQDLTATAQGNWIKQGFSKYPEDSHIALVKDNIDPSVPAISVGNSLPGLPSNVYVYAIQNSGFVNRKFSDIQSDGNIYCFNLGVPNYPRSGITVLPSTSLIIRMDNGITLSAEKRNCDCACVPYQFTSAKVVYTR